MKTKLLLYLILVLGLNSYSQIINVSTGIDGSGNALSIGTVDPFWQIASSPNPPGTPAKVSTSFSSSVWEPTPVSITNAEMINASANCCGNVGGIYTFERDFLIPPGTTNFNYDFAVAYDDAIVSLELVQPDLITIPLTVVPTTTYHLSMPLTSTLVTPMAGTWKIRATINFVDGIAFYLLSGYVNLNCQTLYVDADNDGYDNGSIIDCSGTVPTGYSLTTLGTDCDDTNSTIGSSFVLPTSLQTGLLAQYTFNGGSINDFSGNGHHLTNTTAATDATDRNGNVKCAFEFDNLPNSNNQFLSTTNTAFLNGLIEYSISCWYKAKDPTRGIVDYEVLVGRDYTPFACPDRVGQWALALYDCRFAVFARENSAWQSGGVCNEVEVWHHLTATYNQVGNTLKLYKNGVLQDTETGIANCGTIGVAPALDLGDLFLGKDFTGVLDDVFIHNREITASEVTQLYGLGSSCCSVTNPCTTLVTPNFTPITPVCTLTTVSPLPTTSLNGITGTWSPAFNNVTPLFTITTTTYTFTPDAGQCATSTTMDIQVYPLQDILFIPIDPICSGDTLIPPPNTSLNGIPGTWSPAFNNTTTTTYTFTPDTGYCAVPRTLTITVNPVNPTFNAVAPICSGDIVAPLPTTSLNGITGTWSPAVNNATTTTYTFTPDTSLCATSTTLTIVVNPIVVPTFTNYSPLCLNASVPLLSTTSDNGITGTWSPSFIDTTVTGLYLYTFTPDVGQCAVPTTMSILVNPNSAPTFNPVAPICYGSALAPLPTTSTNGVTGTWSPAVDNTTTTTYTFTPDAGQCASTTTVTIIVNPLETMVVCLPASKDTMIHEFVPTTNFGSIDVLNVSRWTYSSGGGNGYYTTKVLNEFDLSTIPSGAVITSAIMRLHVDTTTPPYNQHYDLGGGTGNGATVTQVGSSWVENTVTWSTAPSLLASSVSIPSLGNGSTSDVIANVTSMVQNMISTGVNNGFEISMTDNSDYYHNLVFGSRENFNSGGIFLPELCVTYLISSTPTFAPVASICVGDTLSPLPTTSINGVTGTWSPAVNNTTTTTYTFTPDAGQCASTATMTIVVNSIVVPTFTPVILDCSASSVAGLPTTSLNAITGSWSPAFNYTTTTTYSFTPNPGQCATTATMTVTVSPNNPCAREIRTDGIDNNCNGFVDEIVTELSASLCGANLTSINQLIVARAVSIPGSTICGYRFLVTKWVGGVPSTNPADIQIITRPSTSFNLTQLPNYAYNTTYSVQVSVCVNGVWQPYGSNCCTVRANRFTKVQASQCGTTLTSMNEVIQADIVNFIAVATYSAPIVKPWRFEITQTSPGVGFGITQPLYYNQTRTFQMSDFPGATYGTTYSVRVAFLNDDLTWSPYGAACTITTPSIPTTQVIASQCNTVVASASTLVYADLVTGATNYRFRLSAAPSFTRVWTNPASGAIGRFFTLNDFSPTGLTAGSLYNIEVCVSMDGGITYGAYGPSCTISTSGAFRPSEIERETSTTDEFSAVVYPNPTIDSFLLEIISESTEPIEIKVYDMIGRQIENRTISFDEVSSTYIGTNYPTGVYNIIITQGEHLKMVKVIKR